MARAAVDKPYVNFSNGLVTEVTKLNYPENSLLDVENMDIDIDGSVRRRLGIEPEINARPFFVDGNPAVSAHVWENPGGAQGIKLVVIQVGTTLLIRNLDKDTVSDTSGLGGILSTTALSVPLRLLSPTVDTSVALRRLGTTKMASAVGFGCLFMFSQGTIPFYLEYLPEAGTVRLEAVGTGLPVGASNVSNVGLATNGLIAYRDFKGVPREFGNGVRPNRDQISDLHLYNLRNNGWLKGLKEFRAKFDGRLPSLADQYQLARNSGGGFDPKELDKLQLNGSPAPNGHLLINANLGLRTGNHSYINLGGAVVRLLARQGSFLSDSLVQRGTFVFDSDSTTFVNNLDNSFNEPSEVPFTCGAFFAGRLFMSGETNRFRPNAIFFSKVIEDIKDAGFCAQVNDPTSEEIPDLLDSDGGVVYIQDAEGIVDIKAMGQGIVIFARGGIWFLRGDDAGFRATSFTVDKISDMKVLSRDCIVSAEDAVYFLTKTGIGGVGFAEGIGVKNLSDERIFSFYQRIPRAALENCQGVYDEVSKKVFWMYRDLPDESNYDVLASVYNRALVMDARNGSFTKYSLPMSFTPQNLDNFAERQLVGIVGGFPRLRPVTAYFQTEVLAEEDGDTEQVFVDGELVTIGEAFPIQEDEKYINNIKLIAVDSISDVGFICDFSNLQFNDILTDSIRSYASYMITQPESLGDLQKDKAATYVYSYFKRTEGKFLTSVDGGVVLDRPSQALLSGQWDWNQTPAGNRFSNTQEAYKFKRPVVGQNSGSDFDNGESVVYTKRKVRGNGRALSLRYEAVPNKDMHILGISVAFTASGV